MEPLQGKPGTFLSSLHMGSMRPSFASPHPNPAQECHQVQTTVYLHGGSPQGSWEQNSALISELSQARISLVQGLTKLHHSTCQTCSLTLMGSTKWKAVLASTCAGEELHRKLRAIFFHWLTIQTNQPKNPFYPNSWRFCQLNQW